MVTVLNFTPGRGWKDGNKGGTWKGKEARGEREEDTEGEKSFSCW